MDENTNYEHVLKTCDIVDDDYFKEMLDFVDGKLGSNDELIVFTHTHGLCHDDEHFTFSDTTKYHKFLWWRWYTDVIFCTSHGSCTSYYDEIGDITTDGTYVFLFAGTCVSSIYDTGVTIGIDSFPSNKHNNHLLTWCFKDSMAMSGHQTKYENFYWNDGITQHFKSPSHLFYNSYNGINLNQITSIIDNDNNWNGNFHYAEYWNDYPLKLRNTFTTENFDLFYLFESNEYIVSSHTNDQIQFTYVNSGPSYTLITESYLLEIPRTTANFHVEITADWSVCSDFPKWNSLLEVGIVDYSSSTFSPYLSIGTKDDTYSETGCFQAKLGSNWHYDTDPDEVLQSRTNVKYILSYTNGQFLCRIKQGTTILYQVFGYTSDYDSINSILIKYQHKTSTASTASYWTIKTIYAEITY